MKSLQSLNNVTFTRLTVILSMEKPKAKNSRPLQLKLEFELKFWCSRINWNANYMKGWVKLLVDFDQKSRGNTVLLDLTKGSFEMGSSL